MSIHLQREIKRLKELMTELCSEVEKMMTEALSCALNHDKEVAKAIIEADKAIDRRELELEEECLKILALHQPVAIDLRYVIASLKMNNDLERIGDLSANIAKNVIAMARHKEMREFERDGLELMMSTAKMMLRECLNALFASDDVMARKICEKDDIVDDLNKKMHIEITRRLHDEPESADYLLRLLTTSRNIERIADYTTNIAEDIIYMVNGEIVRHAGR